MSRLRTGSLEGRDNNKIDFPANQTLQVEGRMDLGNGTYLQMPTWDNANRPSSPILSSIGYNTELLSMEIYSGVDQESGELIGDNGWQPIGEPAYPDLGTFINGPSPLLHYEHDDLADFSNGTTSFNWLNKGTAGPACNLIPDTGMPDPSVQTVGGYKCLRFNGYQSAAFASSGYITSVNGNSSMNGTFVYVYGNGNSSGGSNSSPAFCGHCYGGNTSGLDRVGGGSFGWNFGQIYMWYNNDGGNALYNMSGRENNTFNQWIHRISNDSWTFYKTRTEGAYASGNRSQYSQPSWITGIGHGRRHDISSWTTTGDIVFAAYWNQALDNTVLQNLRDYIGEKYPNLGVINN